MPNQDVFNEIARRKGLLAADSDDEEDKAPYEGIARAGSEPQDITPGASIADSASDDTEASAPAVPRGAPRQPPAQDYAQDPLMQQFNRDDARLRGVQRLNSTIQGNNDFLQGILPALRGTQAPVANDAMFANLNKHGEDMVTQEGEQIGRREKVMEAIAKRNQIASQNALANELKQSRLGLDKTKADNAKSTRDAMTDAYNKRTGVIASTAGGRMDNSNIRTAGSVLKDQNLTKEVTKLNTARSAQSLVDAIRSGELTDSGNISKQLTNMIQTIELGNPGGVGDRQTSGVDTLYSRAKDLESYVTGHPQSRIPEAYLNQLESEVHALGNRAAKNYKATSDSALLGADLSGGVPGGDAGKVHALAKAKRDQLLRANGFDPETGDPIAKPGAASPGFVLIKDPKGVVRKIPASQKDAALKAGGVLAE